MITFSIIGLTFILKYGEILNGVRGFFTKRFRWAKKLFDCALCLGFWSGAIVGGVMAEGIFTTALYGAAVSLFADVILELIQTAIIKLEK